MTKNFLRSLSFAAALAGFAALAQQPAEQVPQETAEALTALGIPAPDHVVIVIEENHSFSEIIGSRSAPYINSLAQQGALFTRSFAVSHPSEPNYLAFFSGSTQGLRSDSCPHTFTGANLGSELIAAGRTFTGFSEGLPSPGSTVCTSGRYARKHSPWVNFTNVPAASNQPFTSFPADFTKLPAVSIVIPNLLDDMHDGTVQQADTFLKQHIDPYLQFAKTHNSLLIVTWDEDDSSMSNQIPTIFIGPMVKQGQFSERINHYNVLRTLEEMYGLPFAGNSATATPITDVWQAAAQANFSVSTSSAAMSLQQGASSGATLTIASRNGFDSPVNLSVSGLPSGVTAAFSAAPVAPQANDSAFSSLVFTASSAVAPGTFPTTIHATSGSLTRSIPITLTIAPAAEPGFGISVIPGALSVARGASISSSIQVDGQNGFNSGVAFSVSGLPAGVKAAFAPASTTLATNGSAASTLTIHAPWSSVTGTFDVTVTVRSGSHTDTVTIPLTVK